MLVSSAKATAWPTNNASWSCSRILDVAEKIVVFCPATYGVPLSRGVLMAGLPSWGALAGSCSTRVNIGAGGDLYSLLLRSLG